LKPSNPFSTLKSTKIGGFTCDYYGQISDEGLPDGVGVAVSEHATNVFEGAFNQG